MIKILLIEDEVAASRRLSKLLTDLDPNIQILDSLDSIESSLEWFSKHEPPDLILMDIHLSDGSSFEICKEAKIESPIIFTTAYDEYAIQAFKVNSVDYLLKPIKKPELANALEKFRKQFSKTVEKELDYEKLASAIQTQTGFQKRILIKVGQKLKAIDLKDAAYFFIESRITLLRTKEGRDFPIDHNLDQLESILDPAIFFRINRKTIVSIESIEKMFAFSKSRVKLDLKPAFEEEAIVSVERSPHFKLWLQGL